MTLPPNTYGVCCEFNPGGQRYTYLVDLPHHGEINKGHHVIIASPKGGYKVILVVDRTEDLAPVDLQYMKYIVQKVGVEVYNTLMNNLTGGPDSKVYGEGESIPDLPEVNTGDETQVQNVPGNSGNPSPLIDEGDTPVQLHLHDVNTGDEVGCDFAHDIISPELKGSNVP